MKKRGLSPVVATLLLVLMVIAIAAIIFLWMRGFVKEVVTKDLGFGEENIELACENIVFSASYYSEKLEISNNGNVPIEDFKIKETTLSGKNSYVLSEETSKETRVRQGKTESFNIDLEDSEKIVVIPILLGESDEGNKEYVCNDRFGIEV